MKLRNAHIAPTIPANFRSHFGHIRHAEIRPEMRGSLRVDTAIQLQSHTDAYCIGHNGLDRMYDIDCLRVVIRRIGATTGRFVTTTEEARLYRKNEELCALGDWLFPDCHNVLGGPNSGKQGSSTAYEAAMESIKKAAGMTKIARSFRKPLMLKMIMFPWKIVPGATPERQAEFFRLFLEGLRAPGSRLRSRPAVATHAAFDTPWKIGYPFFDWDSCTGLLTPEGDPRPAVHEITTRRDFTHFRAFTKRHGIERTSR